MTYFKKIICLIASSAILSIPTAIDAGQEIFNSSEVSVIKEHLFNNISSKQHVLNKRTTNSIMQALPGAVIASPSSYSSQFKMDYDLSWVRDSAIVMDEVVYLYGHESDPKQKRYLEKYLKNYVSWVALTQQQKSIHANISTLGEPIFNIDGTIWNGQWSRPQYDGPALQAITLIHIQDAFKSLGEKEWDKEDGAQLEKLVEKDLDFVTLHGKAPSYSLWEEALDQNFFTEMVQRRAFLLGAQYENQLGNTQKADNYQGQAKMLEALLNEHWVAANGYYSEGLMQQDLKGGSINISIILAALLGDVQDINDLYAPDSDKMLSTAFFIRSLFQNLYFINLEHPGLAPMLGRYQSDKYDGNHFLYGNPWFIATNAMAQFYYLVASRLVEKGYVTITPYNVYFFRQIAPQLTFNLHTKLTKANNPAQFSSLIQALIANGDALLKVSKLYAVCYKAGDCLHFSEQVDRLTGKQVSALDLTWSYVSLLTALQARPEE